MNRLTLRYGAILAAAALAGCATQQGAGVQPGASVTRHHLGQQIARGEIAIEPLGEWEANSLVFAQSAASVARELTRLGWRVVPGNMRSEQVALVRVDQGSRAAVANRPAVSIGVGGGTGGWGRSGVGVGVGATVPVGSGGANEIVVTELGVRIQRRSDGTALWEGRAQTEARAGTQLADRAAAVGLLAEAMFRDFPGESGRTIRVR